jgi:phenylalanyl-tRNA synthetase beta subunit
MLISYNWLQRYFKDKLPSPEVVAGTIIFHAFEVESIEKKGDDFIFDIKILPDRAHDCLSHRGVARELAAHLNISVIQKKYAEITVHNKPKRVLSVNIEESALCRRYSGRVIEGITVGPSPEWLKKHLESIGQKSINNVVDATNFVMFDLGQPLHAFDAEKVSGDITVRKAKKGEKLTTLDGKDLELDPETLIISDAKHPLAIAGIKGGKQAEITSATTSIILEAANFTPENIRKTSRRLGIHTDSSKRFENERSPEGILEAMDAVTALIVEIAGDKNTNVGDVVDVYPRKGSPYLVGISADEVNHTLGTMLSQNEIIAILARIGFPHRVIDSPIEEILGRATALIGVPYKFGASVVYDAPHAFDCSSFLAYLFVHAGIQIPRMAVDQYVFGEAVDRQDARAGDLVFSNTGDGKIYYKTVEWLAGTSVPEGVDHCGLYLGEGNVIHATRTTGKVTIEKLDGSTQFKNIVGFRRIPAPAPRFLVTIPAERLDLRIPEDIIDDIGKAYGYEKISPRALPPLNKTPKIDKTFFYANKIRNILIDEGLSEVYTSSFQNDGVVAIENPVATDKGYLRPSLHWWMVKSLELNGRNSPLLGLDTVKIFEIEKIFPALNAEHLSLAIGIHVGAVPKNKDTLQKNFFDAIQHALSRRLQIDATKIPAKQTSNVLHIDLDSLIKLLPEPQSYENVLTTPAHDDIVYKKISSYPFVLRDIAVFVPPDKNERDIVSVLTEKAGNLLARKPQLFDQFEKKNKETGEIEKISYAFRLVFQSQEKTLSDNEVNVIMEAITKALNSNPGWQVR